jgi:copper chaperone CopZ
MTRNDTPLKPRGAWEVKRRIRVPGMAHQWDARTITERLASISGVRGVTADIERHRLTVAYDITQSNYHEMLAALEEIGFPATNNWWARSKADYFQYLDTNGRENAKAPAAPCCSNPKGISRPRQ